MRVSATVALISVAMGLLAVSANAADVQKGKTIHETTCAKCHESADFAGETLESLTDKIKAVNAGKIKHKTKTALSDEDSINIAAFWLSEQ